jgi:3-oxoacyl-[acyl-carrier-protein] synthase-1
MRPLQVTAYTVTSALGSGRAAHVAALTAERTGLQPKSFETCHWECWTGYAGSLEQPLPVPFARWDCRNNRLAWHALQQDGFLAAVDRIRGLYGAQRIGVHVGTSTSGVHETELAYRHRDRAANRLPARFDHVHTSSTHSVAAFVREALGIEGPAAAISTACSSSAKVFASAWRAIAAGQCDAAVVGGVDSLCLTTLYGFNSLQLVSHDICRPADARRNGISIGEAGGFAILERGEGERMLLGYGETSDAWHMSSPPPDGRGAAGAMRAALARGGLEPADIDYVNLHGTATPANDLAEDRAVHAVLGPNTPVSSTKGWTGHTLGAAGILEAAISLLCIEHGFLPRSLNLRELDPALQSNVLRETRHARLRHVLSNSFGFGGSNCSLLFGAGS